MTTKTELQIIGVSRNVFYLPFLFVEEYNRKERNPAKINNQQKGNNDKKQDSF